MEGINIREMSFQNVLETILKPAGVKVGGFPQEMFQDMTEEEAEKFTCNICFLIVNECRQCDNRHLFCQTCAFAWTLTYGENSQKCPMCRCDQREYKQNKEVDKVLLDKRVHCQEEGCSFKSPLKIFLMHSHGKLKYSNAHVDLESLRPARHTGARLLVLPRLDFSGVTGANRQARGTMILHQLQQGRVMILQMMTLLDLEIQLREQSFISYQSAMEPMARVQRMDEVLALNEQLNEIGTILSALLTTPLAGQAQRYASPEPSSGAPLGISTRTLTQRLLGGIPPMTTNDDDDDDDDDSSSTDSSSSDSSLDLSSFRRRESLLHRPNAYPPSSTLNRAPASSLERTLNEGQAALDQARERREVTQQILSDSSGRGNADQTAAAASDSILRGREPGMTPRIGQLNRARERQPSVLSPRENDATTSATSVLRLSSGDANTHRSGATGGSHASAVGQLPSLAGGVASHSMQSTTDALSGVSSPPRRDQSRQDTPSPVSREPTPPPIPQGSLALRQAMEAMFRSRTPSNLVSRLSGTASGRTTSSNSGATQQGQNNAAASVARPRSGPRGHSSGSEGSSRGESSGSGGNSQERNGLAQAAGGSTPSASGSSPVQQGSILPASLYRRRQRTDSSLSGRSSHLESGVGTSQSRSSSIGRSQNGPVPRSQSIASRRRISAVVPPLNQRDATTTRRPNLAARRSTLSNRLAVDRQTPTSSNPSADGGVSSLTSGRGPRRVTSLAPNRNRVAPTRPPAAAADGSSNLPKLPGGHARPRRRSEIHQNLLMKK